MAMDIMDTQGAALAGAPAAQAKKPIQAAGRDGSRDAEKQTQFKGALDGVLNRLQAAEEGTSRLNPQSVIAPEEVVLPQVVPSGSGRVDIVSDGADAVPGDGVRTGDGIPVAVPGHAVFAGVAMPIPVNGMGVVDSMVAPVPVSPEDNVAVSKSRVPPQGSEANESQSGPVMILRPASQSVWGAAPTSQPLQQQAEGTLAVSRGSLEGVPKRAADENATAKGAAVVSPVRRGGWLRRAANTTDLEVERDTAEVVRTAGDAVVLAPSIADIECKPPASDSAPAELPAEVTSLPLVAGGETKKLRAGVLLPSVATILSADSSEAGSEDEMNTAGDFSGQDGRIVEQEVDVLPPRLSDAFAGWSSTGTLINARMRIGDEASRFDVPGVNESVASQKLTRLRRGAEAVLLSKPRSDFDQSVGPDVPDGKPLEGSAYVSPDLESKVAQKEIVNNIAAPFAAESPERTASILGLSDISANTFPVVFGPRDVDAETPEGAMSPGGAGELVRSVGSVDIASSVAGLADTNSQSSGSLATEVVNSGVSVAGASIEQGAELFAVVQEGKLGVAAMESGGTPETVMPVSPVSSASTTISRINEVSELPVSSTGRSVPLSHVLPTSVGALDPTSGVSAIAAEVLAPASVDALESTPRVVREEAPPGPGVPRQEGEVLSGAPPDIIAPSKVSEPIASAAVRYASLPKDGSTGVPVDSALSPTAFAAVTDVAPADDRVRRGGALQSVSAVSASPDLNATTSDIAPSTLASEEVDEVSSEPEGAPEVEPTSEKALSADPDTTRTKPAAGQDLLATSTPLRPDPKPVIEVVRSPSSPDSARIPEVISEARVTQALRAAVNSGARRISMRLDPPGLGSVTVEVEVEGGVAKVRVVTETSAASGLLSSHGNELRQTLKEQGLVLSEFNVKADAGQSNERGEGSREHLAQDRSRLENDADVPVGAERSAQVIPRGSRDHQGEVDVVA